MLESVPEHQRRDFGLSSKYSITIRFKGEGGWDANTYGFIFDTGAFVSYAPDTILELLGARAEFESYVRGVAPGDDCKVKVKFARIRFKMIDDKANESRELIAWFAFHAFKSPLLLGMKDIIDRCGIVKLEKDDVITLRI
ncbi:MAG: hypothetical protein JW839_11315 [Candidatus Lokiarchaeota archaeon]|nr:hypothetical protein [Candidatus Lokiarchaeota archaeon]